MTSGDKSFRRTAGFGHAEVFAAIAVLSFLVARFVPVLAIPYSCPAKALLGIPCATCGMTHAFVFLAHGQAGRAVAASPLGALVAGGAWLLGAADLARAALGLPLPVPSRETVRAGVAAGLVLLVANWLYLVLTVTT